VEDRKRFALQYFGLAGGITDDHLMEVDAGGKTAQSEVLDLPSRQGFLLEPRDEVPALVVNAEVDVAGLR
jgi:hypothetical protein